MPIHNRISKIIIYVYDAELSPYESVLSWVVGEAMYVYWKLRGYL